MLPLDQDLFLPFIVYLHHTISEHHIVPAIYCLSSPYDIRAPHVVVTYTLVHPTRVEIAVVQVVDFLRIS